MRQVFVTNTVSVAENAWRQLCAVSIAPLIARTLEQLLIGSSIDDVY